MTVSPVSQPVLHKLHLHRAPEKAVYGFMVSAFLTDTFTSLELYEAAQLRSWRCCLFCEERGTQNYYKNLTLIIFSSLA